MSSIDRTANGGVADIDVRIIFTTSRKVDIKGIDNHQVPNDRIWTVGGGFSYHGNVVGIFYQYAITGKGSSIHSSCQREANANDLHHKSTHVKGGLQRITTLEGYVISLQIDSCLATLPIRPFTDFEYATLPHVILTAENDWDTTIYDTTNNDTAYESIATLHNFDTFGYYKYRVAVQYAASFTRIESIQCTDDATDLCACIKHSSVTSSSDLFYDSHCTNNTSSHRNSVVFDKLVDKHPPDYIILRPLFGWMLPDIIHGTFEHTTQYARIPNGTVLKQTFKSPSPSLNVVHRIEPPLVILSILITLPFIWIHRCRYLCWSRFSWYWYLRN
jgi:hypothetical protein